MIQWTKANDSSSNLSVGAVGKARRQAAETNEVVLGIFVVGLGVFARCTKEKALGSSDCEAGCSRAGDGDGPWMADSCCSNSSIHRWIAEERLSRCWWRTAALFEDQTEMRLTPPWRQTVDCGPLKMALVTTYKF
jgi:hypothetical protein